MGILEGHTALVTGASSGLGQNFAHVLAEAGAQVVIVARRRDRLDALADEINAKGGKAVAYALDVSKRDALVDAVAQITQEVGLIDILINNAGVPDAARATKISLDLIDTVMNVNLRGPFILAREVARHLIDAKKPGRIVNIASIAAYNYDGNGAALYSITKAGIARMTEALAVEWARFNINVNGIAPGVFASEMVDGMLERMGDLSQGFRRKRIGRPEQLNSTLLYLCAPESECVTGTVIKVDDGQSSR